MQNNPQDMGSSLLNKVTDRKKRYTIRKKEEISPFQLHGQLMYKARLSCFVRIKDKYKSVKL